MRIVLSILTLAGSANAFSVAPQVSAEIQNLSAANNHQLSSLERSISNANSNVNHQIIENTSSASLTQGIREFLVPPAYAADAKPKPPTESEIKLLRDALSAIYGERNPEKAVELLTKAISAWERQAPDEKAALTRVRADCYMEMLDADAALADYTITVDYLSGPGGDLADPSELPAARLGRARALRSISKVRSLSESQVKMEAQDYQVSLRLSARDDWDTDEENEQDGASRNPYAAWEWGMAQRGAGDYKKAAETHTLAALNFKDIGDKARAVISMLDAGIDLAATDDIDEAKKVLESAIKSTTTVEGRDVELLQRVIAKEGEARIALASVLWDSNAGQKGDAEAQLGEACARLDQLRADADAREQAAEKARIKSGAGPAIKFSKLQFTIDDAVGPECSCARFKNEKFVSETLGWPKPLQAKLAKLNNLK